MEKVKKILTESKAEVAVAFYDFTTNKSILINENIVFHAASTMKTPVMLEVFRQAEQGFFSLDDSIVIKNSFCSIVDSSEYSMNITDDSDGDLYKLIGNKTTIYDLVFKMITESSNLATNLLIDLIKPSNIMTTLKNYGINGVNVLRGVEDQLAYEQGLNNTVTAFGLMTMCKKMAKKELVSEKASNEMINILTNQKHRSMIPALLPEGTITATKSGSITGIRHDSGIIFMPDGRKYVMVFLSKNVVDIQQTNNLCARIAKLLTTGQE
ncbi:MAG TPA: class A beta-lactamase-related serine hydrolase [Ignavibacteriaceae bacterium]|nr:class A beta-lactamase-related serine hydrolase [Ignavibacteriaceae bacterium]HPO55221.1 class A beta-lactamase-related serine hydrolase [Ignavibacteriaceae bacterium]